MDPVREKEDMTDSASQKDSWKLAAKVHQQKICDLVNYDWESYKSSERDVLEKKVQLILFGIAENSPDEDRNKTIKNIFEKIMKEGVNKVQNTDKILMAFIYIIWTVNGGNIMQWPVFKVPKNDCADAIFIDINARVYEDWNRFLKENKFPPCEYCYPRGGKYPIGNDSELILEYGTSPSSSLSNKIVECMDYTNSGLALGTTLVTAASIFLPVAGPLLQTSFWAARGISAYTTLRCGTTLYDRGAHKQSVGLGDPESRSCWLSIGASALGVAASSATQKVRKMAEVGQVAGRLTCFGTTVLNISNISMSALGILNSCQGLKEKYNKQQLSTVDVLQFSASLLLFAHAAVNVQTAKSIIENTQNKVLEDFENSLRSNRHRKMFRKVSKNTRGEENKLEGNAKVIRALMHIDNVDDFFAALVRMQKQFRPTETKVTFGEGSSIEINDNFSVDPTRLVSLGVEDRKILLRATKLFGRNEISEAKFRRVTNKLLGETPTPSNVSGNLNLKDMPGFKQTKPMVMEIKFSYPLLSAYERMELMVVLKLFAESDHESILHMADVLFRALNFTSGVQFVNITYFFCGFMTDLANNGMIEKNVNENQCEISVRKYCVAAFKEFLQNQSKLVQIFNHVYSFMRVLSKKECSQKGSIKKCELRPCSIFEIAKLSSILLRMDKSLWENFLDLAKEIARILGWEKTEQLIEIVKSLCKFIVQSLKDLKLEQGGTSRISETENSLDKSSQIRSSEDCDQLLHILTTEKEIQKSLIEEIKLSNPCSVSSTLELPNITPKFTRQQPLEICKQFWVGDALTLLSKEEIMDVCQKVLELENLPTDSSVEYDGLKVFVHLDAKLITIESHVEQNKISAFVECAPTLY